MISIISAIATGSPLPWWAMKSSRVITSGSEVSSLKTWPGRPYVKGGVRDVTAGVVVGAEIWKKKNEFF